MTQDSTESFVNAWMPNSVEESYAISDIEGEIPRELNGTLYRNGPSQNVLPKLGARALHLFDGDGLVRAIRFEDGQAHHTSAFAKTPKFLNEQKLGQYTGGANLQSEIEMADPPPDHQANTNVVPHSGRLFALVENAPPFEMDPLTLESKGYWDYDGKMLGMSTTAHPKIDGRTGQMLIHGYMPVEPYVQLYVVERDGSVSLAEAIDAPWPSMMHDFAITENYVILPLSAVYFDIEAVAAGGQFTDVFKGRPDLNLKFGIRRREPGSPIRWFDAPSSAFMFHPGNAYEKDGRIYMDACTYEDPVGLMSNLATARGGKMSDGLVAHPYLYEFDLEAGTCKETRLSDIGAEFPRIDDRLVGYENRWGYAATALPIAGGGPEAIFRRITKYDRTGGPSVDREIVPHQWVGEPVFVPRGPDADEDDGFVMYLMYDGAASRTAVEILDARGIDKEPLARMWLRERAPMGFHGSYLPAWS
jgi:carotenoid cleavage dioxygenase-like enzyme